MLSVDDLSSVRRLGTQMNKCKVSNGYVLRGSYFFCTSAGGVFTPGGGRGGSSHERDSSLYKVVGEVNHQLVGETINW